MAMLDVFGIASIMPFIAILSDPTLADSNPILNKLFQISILFGFETKQEFLFILGDRSDGWKEI